jgi:hypothetical protein
MFIDIARDNFSASNQAVALALVDGSPYTGPSMSKSPQQESERETCGANFIALSDFAVIDENRNLLSGVQWYRFLQLFLSGYHELVRSEEPCS